MRDIKKLFYFRALGKASQMCVLAGMYGEASRLQSDSLALCKELMGEDHEHTASCENNIAGMLRYQGEFEKAEPYQKRALEISERVSGNSIRTAMYLGNLAQLVQSLGRHEEAEKLLLRALAIKEALGF